MRMRWSQSPSTSFGPFAGVSIRPTSARQLKLPCVARFAPAPARGLRRRVFPAPPGARILERTLLESRPEGPAYVGNWIPPSWSELRAGATLVLIVT